MSTYTKLASLVFVAFMLTLVAVIVKAASEETNHTYTAYYYSPAKNKELQVTYYSSSNEGASRLAESGEKMWTRGGYKRFYRQGRLGISMLSGKSHSVCVMR
jgi:hypothetical protein